MTTMLITEDELRSLFRRGNTLHRSPRLLTTILNIVKWVLYLFLLFIVSFIILNAPSFYLKAKYFLGDIKLSDYSHSLSQNHNAGDNLTSPAFEASGEDFAFFYYPDLEVEQNHLAIPKIDLNAPIIWETEPANIIKELDFGVAHYKGTALPDQEGNVFITGHSSNYWWSRSSYNTVFALLDKLNNGDEIVLSYQEKTYQYRVREKLIVNPDNVSVMQQTPGEHILTLMTCYPVGTNRQRLIIKADLLAPIRKVGLNQLEPLKIQIRNKEVGVGAESSSDQPNRLVRDQNYDILDRSTLPILSIEVEEHKNSFIPDLDYR